MTTKFRFPVLLTALVSLSMILASCGNRQGENVSTNRAGERAEKTTSELTTNIQNSTGKKAAVADERGYIVKAGDIVPDFDIVLPDGTKKNIKELRGKVVMLQFTASWCSVCRSEMPHIENEIWLKLKDNPDFALYGIDLKETPEQIAKFASNIPVTYPIALDPKGEIFAKFCEKGAGVTRNIIVDREGRMIKLTRLFDQDEFNSMVELINAELAK